MKTPAMDTYPDQQMITLLQKIHEYGDVYSFIFKSEKPLEFTPGMYAHVRIPDGEEGQRTREFSIASAPSEDNVQFTVHERKESPYKQKFGSLREGDSVEIFKIKGKFVLPEDTDTDIVLIAGGIGITPIRSMLIENNTGSGAYKPLLIHVAEKGYLFEKELAQIPNEQKRISRSELEKTLGEAVSGHTEAKFYVSGPPGFVLHVDEKLKGLGIEEENIMKDEFFGYEGLEEY